MASSLSSTLHEKIEELTVMSAVRVASVRIAVSCVIQSSRHITLLHPLHIFHRVQTAYTASNLYVLTSEMSNYCEILHEVINISDGNFKERDHFGELGVKYNTL